MLGDFLDIYQNHVKLVFSNRWIQCLYRRAERCGASFSPVERKTWLAQREIPFKLAVTSALGTLTAMQKVPFDFLAYSPGESLLVHSG